MKTMFKIAASAALASATMAGTSASAATLLVSYSPTTDTSAAFTFNVDSNPVPISSSSTSFNTVIANATGGYAGLTTLTFYSASAGGLFGNYFGLQAFTGTTAAPTIITGVFNSLRSNNTANAGVVTISNVAGAVPEPATWAMMILGMGAVGYVMRRRIKVSEVNFTNHVRAIAGS